MTGNLAISLVAGIVSTAVLLALGVPYAFALGLIVAILDLVPLAGATIAAVIVTTVAFLDSTTSGIIVLIFFVLYQQLENHVLQPVVYGRTVQLSPLAVLIAVLIGAAARGRRRRSRRDSRRRRRSRCCSSTGSLTVGPRRALPPSRTRPSRLWRRQHVPRSDDRRPRVSIRFRGCGRAPDQDLDPRAGECAGAAERLRRRSRRGVTARPHARRRRPAREPGARRAERDRSRHTA